MENKILPLNRENLPKNPIDQFDVWYQEACEAHIRYPNAMSLATASDKLEVMSRIVLLRYFDQEGFVFFSGYDTKKAAHIADNPHVALLFSWLDLERQVKITGTAKKISKRESLKFFASRSRESQIAAWLTQSSSEISSRNLLRAKVEEMRESYRNKEVPLPGSWGGYRVKPESIEFWQGNPDGIHDRLLYVLIGGANWEIRRLLP